MDLQAPSPCFLSDFLTSMRLVAQVSGHEMVCIMR